MKRFLSLLTLASPASRLAVWAVLTVAVYVTPFNWLRQLSLYKRLGWNGAPSIGLTRAYWYILHGHPRDAWQMNRIIFVVLAVGAPLLALDASKLARHYVRTSKQARPLS